MKSIKILMSTILLLTVASSQAQIKNSKTETVYIYGNCGMCESTIEKAGSKNKIAVIDWNKDTKMASVTYDSLKTNSNEILKRIALSGYDNDSFLAPESAYNKLPGCCQYERKGKMPLYVEVSVIDTTKIKNVEPHDSIITNASYSLKNVFDAYFAIKDALIKSDSKTVSAKAGDLLNSIKEVKMEALESKEHIAWMQIVKELTIKAEQISKSNDIAIQRTHFSFLSDNLYILAKNFNMESTVYYQHCPMYNNGKGANWLSKENAIKNPYYGSQMLNCGSTTETIK